MMLLLSILWLIRTCHAFSLRKNNVSNMRRWAKLEGDPLRQATGIRPSLHPITINCLAEILQGRAKGTPPFASNNDNNTAPPIELALQASRVATEALAQRQSTTDPLDGMELTLLEQQTVAGRVVGVTVRLSPLEGALREKCQAASWIAKYQDQDRFGILPDECSSDDDDARLNDRIRIDPLFALSRAECLLALFLHTVEIPELAAKNVTVPDQSKIDFLDEDRMEVLL